MNVLLISASPNRDGLTAACAAAAAEGVAAAGGKAETIFLNEAGVGLCRACERGWGTCLHEHRCKTDDGFGAVHARIGQANGYGLITPVYWGEMSESAKALCDRLRRCEATRDDGQSMLSGKPVLAVAAAGGSGNGIPTCLLSMDRWIQHVKARPFDLIGVNRWSRDCKLVAIREAARLMAREGG